jgi:GNAT superfamily N-acetyltransferase
MRRIQTGREQYEALNPLPWKTAAAGFDPDEVTGRLQGEFDDWWGGTGNAWEEDGHPTKYWPNIEKFLKERYPEAHRDFYMGHEQAGTTLDHYPTVGGNWKGSYETGPDAVSQYGYDPKEIAAGMLLLHNQSDIPMREQVFGMGQDDIVRQDKDRLNKIFQNRMQMQRDYEQRQANSRLAAVNQEMVDNLNTQFHDWWGNQKPSGGSVDDFAMSDFMDEDRGPIGHWPNIENFLKEKYPAAHKGLGMGLEAEWSLDGAAKPYLTGPEAIKQHGYDPSEIAAGMLLLHNQSDPFRGDMAQQDQDRLNDIAQKRYKMQRNYDNRQTQPAAKELVTANRVVREAMRLMATAPTLPQTGIIEPPQDLSPEDERRVISEINNHLSYSRPRAAAELWAQSGIPLSNLTRSEEIASHIRLWGFPQGIDSDWAQAELDDYTLDNYRRDPSNPLPRNHNEIDWENLPPQEQEEGDLGSFEEAFGLTPYQPPTPLADLKAPVENTTDPNAKLKSPWYKKVQHYPSGELPSEFSKRRLYDDFNFGEPEIGRDDGQGWYGARPNSGIYQINDSRRPLHNPPVGYVHYEADHDDKSVKIKYLDVHPKKRGQGVATALVSALAEDFPDYKIAPGSTTPHGTGFVNYMQQNAPGAKDRLDTDQWSPAPPNRLTDEQLNEWGVTKRRSPVFAFIDRHNARVAMRRMRIAAFDQELIDQLRGEYHGFRQ